VPVFTSFGGGTDSSKLNSGKLNSGGGVLVAVVVVVARGRPVVAVPAVRSADVEVVAVCLIGGLAVVFAPLHALRTTIPATATRTLVTRFPTPAG
jgi:hypothetical protein